MLPSAMIEPLPLAAMSTLNVNLIGAPMAWVWLPPCGWLLCTNGGVVLVPPVAPVVKVTV